MKWGRKDWNRFCRGLYDLSSGGLDDFFEAETKEGGKLTYRRAVKNTPVKRGVMRKAWHMDDHVTRRGKRFQISIYNNARSEASRNYPEGAPYPIYVEKGHRIKRHGQTVGYVPGRFILKKAKESAQESIEKTLDAHLKKYIKRKTGL